jgi:hypothetical protein
VLGLVLVALVAGCDPPPGIDAAALCDEYCGCIAPLSSEHAACFAECTTDLAGFDIPEACLQCIEEDACASFESCIDTCLTP